MTTDSLAPSPRTPPSVAPFAPPAPPGPLRESWGYFRANKGAVAGLVIVVAVLLVAAFAELLAPYPPNLTNICAGPFGDPPHNAIFSQEDIYQVIEEGRGAMPSWSIRFLGALNDQQINDLVVYLVETSSENVPFEDNVCLNEEASARALEETELNPRDP